MFEIIPALGTCMAQTSARARSISSKLAMSSEKLAKSRSRKNAGAPRSVHKTNIHFDENTLQKGNHKLKVQGIDTNRFLTRIETPWKIGAHVSSAGGVENAIVNASSIGANAFALFLKPQRKWTAPPLSERSILQFKSRMESFGYESRHIIPHGSYLINLANPDGTKRAKSYDCFLDELKRCEALGLEMYNFHPGSTVGATTLENSISLIADCINCAHQETTGVTILLENMAGAGNIIGGDFAHLAKIIDSITDKSRVGVCFDTCHAFAAGYDIRTKDAWDDTSKLLILLTNADNACKSRCLVHRFSSIIGLKYLRAIHLNDSLCGFHSRKDRHQNVGLGEIGLGGFQHIVRDERTKGIPIILETPSFDLPQIVWGVEISVLGRLSLHASNSDSGNVEEFTEEVMVAVNKAKGPKRKREIEA